MDISKNYRSLIVQEINYVVEKMEESSNASECLFYFSGIHGIIQRIWNLAFHRDLVYIHFILQHTHAILTAKLQEVAGSIDKPVKLEQEHFNVLAKISKELGEKIEEKKDVNETLKKFVLLTYLTTGNGYYLLQKGTIKITDL